MVKHWHPAPRHIAQIASCGLVVSVGIAWYSQWRVAAQKAGPHAAPNGPVRTIPAGERFAGNPGEKGATYYWLESRATRVRSRYADAVVVAERGGDGDVRTTVFDRNGNQAARLTVDAAVDVLQYVRPDGSVFQAINDSRVRPTLEWANRQTYSLWTGGGAQLTWQDGLMRAFGSPAADIEPLELETDWDGGLSAKMTRSRHAKSEFIESGSNLHRVVSGEALSARLTRDGVEIGWSVWYPNDKIFIWHVAGQEGFLEPKHLEHQFGGWPFVPDAEWINLQTIAFQHFKSQIDAKGFVARKGGRCGQPHDGLAARMANFFMPVVHANDPGCDNLHWLDGTVLRFCCDIHDACYSKAGCGASSWWQFWKSWTCDFCNMYVIACFMDGACTCYPPYAQLGPDVGDDRTGRERRWTT